MGDRRSIEALTLPTVVIDGVRNAGRSGEGQYGIFGCILDRGVSGPGTLLTKVKGGVWKKRCGKGEKQ